MHSKKIKSNSYPLPHTTSDLLFSKTGPEESRHKGAADPAGTCRYMTSDPGNPPLDDPILFPQLDTRH